MEGCAKSFCKFALSISIYHLTIGCGAIVQFPTNVHDFVAQHTNKNLLYTAIFLCCATVFSSLILTYFTSFSLQLPKISTTKVLIIIRLLFLSTTLLFLSAFVFILLLNMKLSWLVCIIFPTIITLIWLLLRIKEPNIDELEFSVYKSEIHERFVKLINFTTNAACVGIVGSITANLKNNDSHHAHLELLVICLFFVALIGLCSMLLVLVSPFSGFEWSTSNSFLYGVSCASFIILVISEMFMAYDLVNSLYAAVFLLLPGFIGVVGCLATERLYPQVTNTGNSSHQESKLMDIWMLLGGMNFMILTAVYGLYSNKMGTVMEMKGFVVSVGTAFSCCLVHLLLELRKRQNGENVGWVVFFLGTALMEIIVLLNCLILLVWFAK